MSLYIYLLFGPDSLGMSRKLFTEEFLAREIPEEIMERIASLAGLTDKKIYDRIADSEEVKIYEKSFAVPPVIACRSTSVLLEDLREKNAVGAEKSKKSGDGKRNKNACQPSGTATRCDLGTKKISK